VTTFIYGTSDVSCAVGIAEPSEGGDPLPFLAFFKLSSVPEAELGGLRGGADAMDVIKTVQQRGGVVVYFDNPDSAERIHKLLSVVFSAASRFDWADREEFKETIN
jgi:hypothetical protein